MYSLAIELIRKFLVQSGIQTIVREAPHLSNTLEDADAHTIHYKGLDKYQGNVNYILLFDDSNLIHVFGPHIMTTLSLNDPQCFKQLLQKIPQCLRN